MPVPGPRTQHGPDPGYRNPESETPTRFNRWERPAPVAEMGRTPAIQYVNLRGNVLGAGQVRHYWRQAINYVAAMAPYSWTTSAPNPNEPSIPRMMLAPSRALRYMTRSFYLPAGTDNTRFAGLHTKILPQVRSKPVTLGAGLTRSRPTIRNRMTSFGSRVPALNQQAPAAEQ